MDVNAKRQMLYFLASGIMAAFVGPFFVVVAGVEQHGGLAVLAVVVAPLAAVATTVCLGNAGRCRGDGG